MYNLFLDDKERLKIKQFGIGEEMLSFIFCHCMILLVNLNTRSTMYVDFLTFIPHFIVTTVFNMQYVFFHR